MILSALNGPVRPAPIDQGCNGLAVKHDALLASHLDELKFFILQWAEAHEQFFLGPRSHEYLLQPEHSDRPHSAASYSPQVSRPLVEDADRGPPEIPHLQGIPDIRSIASRADEQEASDSGIDAAGNIVKFQSSHEFLEIRDPLNLQTTSSKSHDRSTMNGRDTAVCQNKAGTNCSHTATSKSENKRGSDAVFMGAQELKEATQMLGFTKRTGGRLHRHLSVLQHGLDHIMPSQGQRVQEALAQFEKSVFFEFLCFTVITVNTVGLTVSTQRQGDDQAEGKFLEDLELACAVFYTFELMIRLSVHQFRFFYAGPVAWNLFDFMLVVMAIQEQATKNSSNNMSYLRTTRILKVLKVLRVIRLLRFFKELRLIIGGILASSKSLLWTVLLVGVITFMFSICFVQGMTGLTGAPGELVDWSSIYQGMIVLFMSGTGGIDWKEACDPLLASGAGYYILFLLYIFIFTFVIQNTITSLFVECLFEKQNSDEAFLISDRLERRNEYSARIQSLYAYMDEDRDGLVTYDELCANLQDPRMVAFAESLEMELTDLRLFFNVLTCGGRNPVDIETFVVGCIKLRGNAKSIDLVDISRQLNKIQRIMQLQIEPMKMEIREVKHILERNSSGSLVPLPAARRKERAQTSPITAAAPADAT